MNLARSYPFQVHPQEVDFQCKLTLTALTEILLDTADFNANDNGFGLARLQEQQCGWVLSKLVFTMDYFPEQYQDITVETWVEEVGRASTTRNFCIRNAAAEIIGYGISVWVMLDMNTRRMKDLSTLEGIAGYANGQTVPIDKPAKLGSLATEAAVFNSFRIRYSDIDFNGHVSTARYVRWLSDCFPLEKYKNETVKRFEVNFVSEVMYDDEVQITGLEIEPNDFHFEIKTGDKVSCKARICFDMSSEK